MIGALTDQLEQARASVATGQAAVAKLTAPQDRLAQAQAALDADRRALAELELAQAVQAANAAWLERVTEAEDAQQALEFAARGLAELVATFEARQRAANLAARVLADLAQDRRVRSGGPGLELPDGTRVACTVSWSRSKQGAALVEKVLRAELRDRAPARPPRPLPGLVPPPEPVAGPARPAPRHRPPTESGHRPAPADPGES